MKSNGVTSEEFGVGKYGGGV